LLRESPQHLIFLTVFFALSHSREAAGRHPSDSSLDRSLFSSQEHVLENGRWGCIFEKKNRYYRLATLQEYATSIVWTLERLSISQFLSSSCTYQWNASNTFSDNGGVMGGKWSPQVGKFGGIAGRSPCVPTCRTRFMPINMWNKKWQWNSQYPTKKIDIILSFTH